MNGPPAAAVALTSRSREETRRIAAALGEALDPVPRAGFVVALHGDLGAGKTVFASGFIGALGVPPGTVVASPTFTVFRSYLGRVPIQHVDAYMVGSREALEGAGLHEIGGNGHVACVEWAERIADALPPDRIDVDILTVAPSSDAPSSGEPAAEPPRRLEVRAGGPVSRRVLARWEAILATSGNVTS